MKNSALITVLLFMGVFTGKAFGIGLTEVNLQDISTSGKSLIIDRGNLEEYKEGLLARFYLQKGPKEFPKVFLVAEGELVKSFPRKSYWILRKIHIPSAIKRDSKVLISTSNELLRERPLKMRNKHVVISDSQYQDVDDYIDQNQENVPSRLVKEDKPYAASADIFERDEIKDVTPETDVLLTTYESYKKKSGNYYSDDYGDLTAQKYFIGNKQVALGDIKKAEDKKLFDSMSDGYERKTNGMKYGIKSFYSEQARTPGLPEIAEKGVELSTYARMKEDAKLADQVDPRAMAKMKRDGDQWSSDMDDAALRRYFIQTGMEKEIRRRDLALNELEGHEIMLHYSGSMVAHGNTQDPNYQGRGYSLGIAYDLHLARTSASLKKWSLQFFLERGVTEYDTGEFNARSEETDYGAYLNYYFINNPLTLNSFIYLAGVGFKNGSASVSSPDLSKEYSYQLLSPSLQLMTKYRFRSGDLKEDTVNVGVSVNFGVNIDMKNLSVIDRVDDNINSKISVTDLKYILGMSVYF
nr:hypothetical protein BHI3_17300 [Bacteriovorax sp. HI3]